MLTNRLGMAIARFRRPALAPGGPDFSAAAIGDEIGGGIYAGIITYADARKFHLVFAKQAGEVLGLKWGNYQTTTGATDPDDGKANQELILTSFDDGGVDAFYHCRDYVDGEGNADYYLPAKNELAKAAQLFGMSHAEFSTDLATYRWTSTESSAHHARHRRFSDNFEYQGTKYNTSDRVRPVRRVAV